MQTVILNTYLKIIEIIILLILTHLICNILAYKIMPISIMLKPKYIETIPPKLEQNCSMFNFGLYAIIQ